MEVILNKNQEISSLEEDGFKLLEEWLKIVFKQFGIYGIEAKVNIKIVFNELDEISADFLKKLDTNQFINLFFASLKLKDLLVTEWRQEKRDGGTLVYASIKSTPEISYNTVILAVGLDEFFNLGQNKFMWSVLRPEIETDDSDALQRILLSLASLAFVLEYIEGVGGVDRESLAILELEVAKLSYPQVIRNGIRKRWNHLQQQSGNAYTL